MDPQSSEDESIPTPEAPPGIHVQAESVHSTAAQDSTGDLQEGDNGIGMAAEHIQSPRESSVHGEVREDTESASDSDAYTGSNEDHLGWGDSYDETDAALAAMEEAATTSLFEGPWQSCMGATYLMLNSGKLHICSNTYRDELF